MSPSNALFIAQYYRPELIGSAPYCADVAEWWTRRGGAVTVVTSRPHYPRYQVFAEYQGAVRRRETINGVAVLRLGNWIPARPTPLRRILSEMHFLALGLIALASGRIERRRLVFSLCPSILAVWLGTLALRRPGRHIAIVHDIQSGLAVGLGLIGGAWLGRLMRWCERKILDRVDLIAVPSPEMREKLRKNGVAAPIEVLPIWVDTDRIRPLPPAPGKAPTIVYSGNLGRKQGLGQIVALASELRRRRPELRITLRGDGSEATVLAGELSARGLVNVDMAGLVAPEKLNEGLAAGDIHLVLQDANGADFAMPSKAFNVMAAGRPFVATARPGSALWRLRQESGAFLCVAPYDARALADAVLRLADDAALRRELGACGRRFVEQRLHKPKILAEFLALIEGLDAVRGVAPRGGVILETETEGHASEWLEHLVRSAVDGMPRERFCFVVAAALRDRLAALVPPSERGRVRVDAMPEWERALCASRRLTLSAFAQWRAMRRHLRRTGAASAHFLMIDHLSLPLALGLGFGGATVSGILFRPSVHYRSLGPYRPAIAERMRDFRKSLLYRLMLLNPALGPILTPDPYFAEFAAGRYRHGDKVRAIVDPLGSPLRLTGPDQALARLYPHDRVRFLLFGSLTRRKGVVELLEALLMLAPTAAAQAAVIFAGKIGPDIRAAVTTHRHRLVLEQPNLWLHIEDRRLEPGELEGLIEGCDVVLAPYQRFVGSSGVLLRAARAGKPVVTQDFGLVGRQVKEHRLGVVTDASDPRALARSLEAMILKDPAHHVDRQRAAGFAAARAPSRFASTIFATLRGS